MPSRRPMLRSLAFGSATTDAQNTAQPGQNQSISYLRNSVKATVDAYNGNVTLYAFDDSDPVLKTWMKAFPGSVQPSTAISPQHTSASRGGGMVSQPKWPTSCCWMSSMFQKVLTTIWWNVSVTGPRAANTWYEWNTSAHPTTAVPAATIGSATVHR